MNKISLVFLVALLTATFSCTKEIEPLALEFPEKCFPEPHKFTYDGNTAFTTTFDKKNNYFPNCFTPNGDGINDSMLIYLSVNDFYTWRNMTIFDSEKNIVRELKRQNNWDGKLNDGSIVNGTYGFRIEIKYNDKDYFNAYGLVCVRECLEASDDVESIVFGDQLHPKIGESYDTREPLDYCN